MRGRHLLLVEAYDGMLELLSANPAERAGARALGLPVGELAERIDCRVTVLTWDEWLGYEAIRGTFFDSDRVELSLSLAASPPVSSDRVKAREGMPDLQPTVEIGPSLDVRLWRSDDERLRLRTQQLDDILELSDSGVLAFSGYPAECSPAGAPLRSA